MASVELDGQKSLPEELRWMLTLGFSGNKHSDETELESQFSLYELCDSVCLCCFSHSLMENVSRAKRETVAMDTDKSRY